MKVLLLAQYSQYGGTRTYVKQLIDFYKQLRIEAALIASGPNGDDEIRKLCCEYGVRFLEYKEFQGPSSESLLRKLFYKKNCIGLNNYFLDFKPDIIVVSVGAPGLWLKCFLKEIPVIYILHTYPIPHPVLWRRFVIRALWSLQIPGSVQLVTVSEYSKKQMVESWGLWRNRNSVKVIYNTAGNIEEFSKKRDQPIQVLTVGHVIDYKNPINWIQVAIKVLKVNTNIKFLWVGPGPLLGRCRDEVNDLSLQDRINFIGPSENMRKYFFECDIYVQPSKIESLSLSVLDSMRYGKPSVVSKVGGLTELVSNGETGYIVEEGDLSTFADKISDLAEDSVLRDKMGRAAQHKYASLFSKDHWVQKMLYLHNSVLQNSKGKSVNLF